MSDLKYAVVDFGNNEGVALVPYTWIFTVQETKFSYWPPFKTSAACLRAAEKCQPPELTWKSYECHIMYSTDDYAKATSKVREAEITSSLESEVEAVVTPNNRKKRVAREKYAELSESESDLEPPEKRCAVKAPKPPMSTSALPVSPLPPPPPTSNQSDIEVTPSGRNCAFERHVLTLLNQLKDSVVEVKKELSVLGSKGYSQSSGPDPELPPDVSFPLQNTEGVVEFEAKLQDSNLNQLIVRNLSSIGGTSLGDCTRRVLRHMYTNACAKELNWKGRGGKLALEKMSVTSAIIRAVRTNALAAKASQADIENQIKDWLKFAKERDGGRKSRVEKKRLSEPNVSGADNDN